jgi:hypothetical protein
MKPKKIQISDRLKNILIEMEDRCDLSKMLLSEIKGEYLINDHVDFIDLSTSDSGKLSYLNKERISKIEKDGLDFWKSINLRYQSKPGSLLTKIFNNSILNNRNVENFSNLFKATISGDKYNFKIVAGSDIKTWYDGEYYANHSGSLGNSCMKHEGCQKFFDIYIKNNVKMLIMTDSDDMLVGRALIWEAIDDLTGNPLKVLDRIYTINDDELSPIFKKWATTNGYIYRQNQNWISSLHWIESGNVTEKKMSIKLDKWEFGAYPYLDSFKFLNLNTGVLTNYIPDGFIDNRSCKVLIDAGGRFLDSNTLVVDDITHYFIHRNDCAWLENENIYTSYENVNHSRLLNRYILRTDSLYVEEIDDYIYLSWERNPEEAQKFVTDERERVRKYREEKEKERELKKIHPVFNSGSQMSVTQIYGDLSRYGIFDLSRYNIELVSNLPTPTPTPEPTPEQSESNSENFEDIWDI